MPVPTDIPNLTAWYDADDAATITHVGGAVSQWNDKSGNGKNVTQGIGSGWQPMTGTVTQNGRNTINFNGSSWLSRTGDVFTAAGALSVFVVAKATASARKVAVSQASTSSGLGPTHRLGMEGGGIQWYIFQQDSGTVNGSMAGAVDLTGACRVWRWTDTGSSATQCVDGRPGQVSAYTRGAYNPNNFRIGSLGMSSNQDHWVGPICEVVIYSRVLTAAEIVQVESYLSIKWGTSGPLAVGGCQLWLDAADATSIIDAGAGAVSQWSDKSGIGRHVSQATGSARPTTGVATQNGKNLVSFDGGDYLAYAGGTGVDLDAMTMFVVFYESTEVVQAGVVVYHAGAGDDSGRQDAFSVATGTTAQHLELARYFAGPGTAAAITGTGVAPLSIWRAVLNGSALSVSRNGVAGTGGTRAGTYTVPPGGIVIGGRYLTGAVDAGYRLNGKVAEIVVYDTVLSAASIALVEDYLQAKWFPTPVAGIPNVRSWLDASDPTMIVGSPNVTTWTDKSGMGNSATAETGNAVTGVATLNGKNGLRFSGDRMTWCTTPGAFTMFAVAIRSVSTGPARRLISSFDGAGGLAAGEYIMQWTGTDSAQTRQWTFYRGATDVVQTPVAGAYITTGRGEMISCRTGASGGRLWVNGSLEASAATALSTASIRPLYIGEDSPGAAASEWWEGDIFELILYDRELSDTEVSDVHRYLMVKYNIGPLNIPGIAAHYDASVSTSITDAGAGAVSQWNDLSGHDRHLTQAQPGERPTTGAATLIGLNVISFDGTSDHLDRTTPFLAGLLNGHTVFVVAKATATGTRVLVSEGHTSQTNSAVRILILAGDACQINVDDDSNATRYAVNAGDIFDGSAHLTTWLDSRTLASIQVDAGTPVSSPAYVRGTVTTTKFSVGAMGRATPTLFFQGQIAEIMIFNGVLSAADITTVKNYMNGKWFIPPLPVGVGQWTEENDGFVGIGAFVEVVVFDVEFSQPVTGFTDDEVTLSGTALPTTARIAGSGANYMVLVSGMSVDGTVIASIPAGVAQNADGDGNLPSTSTDNIADWVRVSAYDDLLDTMGTVWHAKGQIAPVTVWPTYTQAIAGSLLTTWGADYVKAWTDEYAAMEWPTTTQAGTDDARVVLGTYWMGVYVTHVDLDIYADVLPKVWLCELDGTTTVSWPTYTQAISSVLYATWGADYAKAWTIEYTSMEWPTKAQSITDDAYVKLGPYWIAAYASYLDLSSYASVLTKVWISELDEMTPVGSTLYKPEVLSDSPVRFYMLDEAAGASVVVDSGSDGANGSYQNGAGPAGGTAPWGGPCVDLSGTNQFIQAANRDMLGEWSAEAWVWLDAMSIRGIVGCWGAGSTNHQWSMSTWDGTLIYLFTHVGGYSQFAATFNLVGAWHHVVVVRRTGTSSIYVDGIERATGSIVAQEAKASNPVLTIGYGEAGHLDGRVAGVAVYNHALAAARVLSHYNVGAT